MHGCLSVGAASAQALAAASGKTLLGMHHMVSVWRSKARQEIGMRTMGAYRTWDIGYRVGRREGLNRESVFDGD